MANASKRSLGRGLASLIPDSTFDLDDAQPRVSLRHIPVDEIRPNPEQPRRRFEPEALRSLASSLSEHGVLTPLVVRREHGSYVLIAGERRLRAAALVGLRELPCMVREADASVEQLELALIENLQREDLDAVEAAEGYRRLTDEFALTQKQVAERVGKNRATIANAIRLLALPDEILDVVREGRLSAGHARALLPLSDDLPALRRVVAVALDKGWSVRDTERHVARLTQPASRARAKAERDRTYDYATQVLTDALHTAVAIRPLKKGGGRIVLDYADDEDLERLIQQLRG